MGKVLNDWLFAAMAASTVMMSICTLQPEHPLALLTRSLGYGLAALCLPLAMVVLWLRRPRSSQ
jgi:hypothetical protein